MGRTNGATGSVGSHPYVASPGDSLSAILESQRKSEGGLATIEAIYAAYRLLGRDTTGLLDHYRWGSEFIELNRQFWPLADPQPAAS